MPISFGSSDAEGTGVYIRGNLPQNRWWAKTEAGDEPIDMERGFACDIKEVVFGWLHIDVGVRDWQPWPSPSQKIERPSESHKQGFSVKCWLADGREAEFSGNSYGLGQFIAKLYNQAEGMEEFNMGKVPVVQVTSTTPVVVGKGTSYDVGFNIRTWIDKPAGGEPAPAAPAPAPVNAAPAPAPAAPPAAAPAEGNNFGF
jgi:hypothetical protein